MKTHYIDLLGILFVVVFCSFVITSIIICNNYNPLENALSMLGICKGAIYFNLGLIFSGFIGVFMSYKRYNNFNKILMIIGIISMYSLLCVGLFPIKIYEHLIFTTILFTGMIAFFVMYTILTRSIFVIFMLLLFIVFLFINICLTEFIIFISVNLWVLLSSTRILCIK